MKQALPLIQRLREGTRHHHRRLDHHPELKRLTTAGLTPRDYAHALQALYRPLADLEASIEAGIHALGIPRQTLPPSRLPLLAQDLADVGMPIPESPLADPPIARTPATLVGQRYVLEGSRLGGEVLARLVRQALGAEVPLRFFSVGEAAAHWTAFVDFAGRYCPAGEEARAVEAAGATFERFRLGLAPPAQSVRQ
ncbi:biliverdin-producing heme oxygenase [Halomonas sp. HK25]|uniref:biliverdin-producing heme oxygenase n=1 Tax=Halomonas sp. HK25 TaxID=3394321 RepID=UPI0039FCC6D7